MFCENCGKTIADSAAACPHCGQATGVGQAAAVVARLPRLTTLKFESGIASFCAPLFRALEDGLVIRTLVALALRILAILVVMGGIYVFIDLLKAAFSEPTTQVTIGGLIAAVFLLLGAVGDFFILFYRAASIGSLGDSSFTVIPSSSVIFRACGEIYAASLITVGVAGSLQTWFTGSSPLQRLGLLGLLSPSVPTGGTFVDGLVFLVAMFLIAFACLILFYFLAEVVLVGVDIAKNVRSLAEGQPGVSSRA